MYSTVRSSRAVEGFSMQHALYCTDCDLAYLINVSYSRML